MVASTPFRAGFVILLALLVTGCGADDSAPPGSLRALDAVDWAAGEPPTTPAGDVDPIEVLRAE